MWPRLFLIALMLVLPVGAAHAASNDCFATASAPTYEEGKSAPCSVTLDGKVRVDAAFSGEITGADGAITDGASAAIKATVKDYTNSNPLTVIPVDTNGDPATLGGGTQYQQGTASTTTDTMNMLGCVRVDTPAVASGVIDGDRARCIVDNTNRIWVHVGVIDGTVAATQSGTWNIGTLATITNPVAVTGTFWQATQPVSGTVAATQSGTWTVQPGNTANTTPWLATINQGGNSATVNGSGQLAVNCANCSGSGVSQQDNTGFTPGTTNFVPMGGEVDDTGTTAVAENSAGAARITAQRAVHMNLRNNSGTEIGTSGAPVRIDPTGSTTQPVSGTVSITANSAVNVAQMNGVNTSMGVGASGTGTQRVASLIHDGTDTAQVTSTSGGSLQVECTAGCAGSGGTSSNFGSAFPTPGTAAGFTDGTNMVAARVVTSAPSSGDAGLVVRSINPASGSTGSAVPSVAITVGGTDGTNLRAIKLDSSGEAQVDVLSLPALPTGSNTIGALVANQSVNNAQMNGVTILMGAGGTGTGSQRVTEANDSQLSAGVGATGDSAATAGSTGSITAKLRLMTSQLDTISTAVASLLTSSQLVDDDQTGASVHHRVSAGSTEDEHEIKGSAGRLFSISATNTNAAVRYLRCANQVIGSTTPGTTTVFYGLAIPGATTGAGFTVNFGPAGLAFSTGLTCWLVTGAAESDVAEVAANEINVNYTFK